MLVRNRKIIDGFWSKIDQNLHWSKCKCCHNSLKTIFGQKIRKSSIGPKIRTRDVRSCLRLSESNPDKTEILSGSSVDIRFFLGEGV